MYSSWASQWLILCTPGCSTSLQCPKAAFPKYDLCKRKPFHGILIRNNFSECVPWWTKFGEKAGVLEKVKRFFISGILKAFNSFREYSMCTLNILGEGCCIQPSSNIADHAVVLLSIYRRGHLTNTLVIVVSMQLPHETSSATTRIVSLFTHCCIPSPWHLLVA